MRTTVETTPVDEGGTLSLRWQVVLVAAILFLVVGVDLAFGSNSATASSGPDLGCAASVHPHLGVAPGGAIGAFGPSPLRGPRPSQPVPVVLALGQPQNWSLGGNACYLFGVEYSAPTLQLGHTEFEVKSDLCAPISETITLQVLTASGQVFATEVVGTFEWAPSATLRFPSNASLLLSSSGPLVQDELVSNVTAVIGGSPWSEQTAMQVAPYSGAWQGCSF